MPCTLKSRNISSSFCIIIASIEPRFNFSIDVLPHIIAAFHLITQYLIFISTSTLHFRLHSTSERIRLEGEPFKVKRCTSILCKPHAPPAYIPLRLQLFLRSPSVLRPGLARFLPLLAISFFFPRSLFFVLLSRPKGENVT